MLPHSTEILSCRACRAEGTFELANAVSDDREIRSGVLVCSACGESFEIESGIAELLHRPPEHVVLEANGLDRFADLMTSDGWGREKIMQLPYIEDGYWFVQARAMEFVLEAFDFKPGERILDIGSNTCWASAQFARLGMQPYALDITKTMMQGLYTAEWWMDEEGVQIERILGSMFDIPLGSNSMDYVFCCEVLHHNDSQELPRTLAEIFRVLKPGGKLIVVNETLKTLMDRVGNHAEEAGVTEFEGYEHAYFAHQYIGSAKRAGFEVEVVPPPYLGFFIEGDSVIHQDRSVLGGFKVATRHALRRSRLGRRAVLEWKIRVPHGANMSFIATKPR